VYVLLITYKAIKPYDIFCVNKEIFKSTVEISVDTINIFMDSVHRVDEMLLKFDKLK
jgi:hypothetical protein